MNDIVDKPKIGLALSGGGYRAAGFHLGTLKKLKEMGILDRVHVISSVSGGSITSGYYLLNKENFDEFTGSFENVLQKSTALRIIFSGEFIFKSVLLLLILFVPFLFIKWEIAALVLIAVIILVVFNLYNIISLSSLAEKAYKKIFFGDKKLVDLPDLPIAAINAANLETGTMFTFSKTKMGDSSYSNPGDGGKPIEFIVNDFPLSAAVASSTCAPPPFNPVTIFQKHFKEQSDYKKRAFPELVDSGVYDNQGIHKLTEKKSYYHCDVVICSDGSMPFKKKFFRFNPLLVLLRVNDVMMRRIKDLQSVLNVYNNSTGEIDEISYYSINWEYGKCIEGFLDNLKNGQIRERVVKAHNISEVYDGIPGNFDREKIEKFIKDKIKFDKIIKNRLTDEQITKICNLATALNGLSKEEIELLSRHASILTEIQVRLYCPLLITE